MGDGLPAGVLAAAPGAGGVRGRGQRPPEGHPCPLPARALTTPPPPEGGGVPGPRGKQARRLAGSPEGFGLPPRQGMRWGGPAPSAGWSRWPVATNTLSRLGPRLRASQPDRSLPTVIRLWRGGGGEPLPIHEAHTGIPPPPWVWLSPVVAPGESPQASLTIPATEHRTPVHKVHNSLSSVPFLRWYASVSSVSSVCD